MMDTVTLERMKLVALQVISEELAEEFAIPPKVEVSAHFDMYGDIALRVIQTVYGRTMEEVSAEWPYDWWQAFKQRWFPAWAKKRWPVMMHKVILEAKDLYPKLSLPADEPQLQLYRCDGAGWDD
jgi:hypothetical protein